MGLKLGPSPFGHPFWGPFTMTGDPMKCLDEWSIIEMSKLIRSKIDWKTKYKNETIVNKWKAEFKSQFTSKTRPIDELIEYVFQELAWYEYVEHNFNGFEESGFVIGSDDKIVYSDSAIPDDIKTELRANVESFAKAEFGDKPDYHPGSNNQVIDLVHPSLYPLQYGITPKIVKYEKKNHQEKEPEEQVIIAEFSDDIGKVKQHVEDWAVSKNYQWLPALLVRKPKYSPYEDVGIHSYEFESYINNLHPKKYGDLYKSIEKVFNLTLPGLNFTLSRLATRTPRRIQLAYQSLYTKEYYEKFDKLYDEVVDENYDKIDEFESKKLDYLVDRPVKYTKDHPVNYDFNLLKSFSQLHVIVKLANIELTPSNPKYNGGSWHVEGTINEDIVATILYYYDSDNITESRLSFRGAFDEPNYDQDDKIGCEAIYGIKDGETLTRMIGDVECKENRVVVFPNWFQHHVEPFELKDKTKNGHRKILCMFVCDPYNDKVVSTVDVPPQQKSWWEDPTPIEQISKERMDKITKMKGDKWPIDLEESKSIREKLMKERSISSTKDIEDENPFLREFSLCEH
ncbi:hypothetical protein CAAN1_25S00782 [[Candida] anglica]|uniref:Prolyl 4-hydroxylase alpha subunit Fe(2+) 2OG dioxygenase domain-containing protein n=1 Tax=[Candida] anglica TaxID=148631 RepID=A0ABP0EDF2_9ASCO